MIKLISQIKSFPTTFDAGEYCKTPIRMDYLLQEFQKLPISVLLLRCRHGSILLRSPGVLETVNIASNQRLGANWGLLNLMDRVQSMVWAATMPDSISNLGFLSTLFEWPLVGRAKTQISRIGTSWKSVRSSTFGSAQFSNHCHWNNNWVIDSLPDSLFKYVICRFMKVTLKFMRRGRMVGCFCQF